MAAGEVPHSLLFVVVQLPRSTCTDAGAAMFERSCTVVG